MRFRTVIEQSGKTATGIRIPDEVVAALGAGKRPPVRVTINGFTYRSTVAVLGGAFMIGVSAENRAGANVLGGDEVDVDLELDTEPRVVTEPPDFAAALDADRRLGARLTASRAAIVRGTSSRSKVRGPTRLASAGSRGRSRCFGRVERADLQRRRPADSVASGHRPRCGARLDPTGAGAAGHRPVLSCKIPLGPFESSLTLRYERSSSTSEGHQDRASRRPVLGPTYGRPLIRPIQVPRAPTARR